MTAALVLASISGCSTSTGSSHHAGEGESEYDLPLAVDHSDTGVVDAGVDLDAIVPTPSDQVLCFPGDDGTWATCLPLVLWDPSWGAAYDYPSSTDERYPQPQRFVDLNAVDVATLLAPDFELGEVMQSSKGRFGIFQGHAMAVLQALRDATGGPLSVNSGYRSVTYNEGVGGVEFSRHQWGDAVDIASDVLDLAALGALCESYGAAYVGYYEAHVHCDWRDDPLDTAIFGP